MSPSPRRWLLLLAAILLTHGTALAQTRLGEPDLFSYQLPPGWSTVEPPGSPYPTAVEISKQSAQAQARAMISVTTDTASGDLANWCAKSLARNKAQFATLGAQVGTLEPFTTDAGAIGYRAPIDLTARGRAIHYVMYFFDGGSNAKIAFTCACSASDAPHYAPLFETAMKTFLPK